jgi:hypothetical protein
LTWFVRVLERKREEEQEEHSDYGEAGAFKKKGE